IKIAGKPTMIDTVAYTLFGPVMYDRSFGGKRTDNQKNYAVRWSAHAPSNELLIFNMLNRAKNYDNYNVFAEMARPIFLKNINEQNLNATEKKYFDLLKNWDLRNNATSKGAT